MDDKSDSAPTDVSACTDQRTTDATAPRAKTQSGTELMRRDCLQASSGPLFTTGRQAGDPANTGATRVRRRKYLRGVTTSIGLTGLLGAADTVAAASRDWVTTWYSGDPDQDARTMNIHMYACKQVSDSNRDSKIDAMRRGLSTVENAVGDWFDGWRLVVYDASLELDCDGTIVSQMDSYLDDVDDYDPVCCHFIHKCNNSNRQGWKTAWNDRTVTSYSTNNDVYDYSDVRVFHEALHAFIDSDLDDVRDLTEGDSDYQREHSLGTVDQDTKGRTIMADLWDYKTEAREMGFCSNDIESYGAVMKLSYCTQRALKYTSDDRA